MPAKTTQKSAYHHGDLRDVLITLGVEMLREVGPEALSLRELARRIDRPVSHLGTRRVFAEVILAIPVSRWSYRTRNETAAAVRAHVAKYRLDAMRAERAFERADSCEIALGR